MRFKPYFLLIALMTTHSALASPIVTIEPSATVIAAGSSFSVDINIVGAVDVYAFQFDFGFDDSAVVADSTLEGSFLSNQGTTFFIPGTIDNAAGTVSFTSGTLISAIPGATGDGTLATISLTAIAASTSSLSLFNIVLLDSQLSAIDHSSVGGSVTVTAAPVPEPAAIALIAIGVGSAFRTLRINRRRSREARSPSAKNN